ncbi:MAG TPA: biopolymer transporter ExbD [Terriglobia bacterium]|jgi:biopolymer transport protein ExbD/biopolymer transport protein TolR|nr:biopolymer transporter ExbD [Terriglobia bacterium]
MGMGGGGGRGEVTSDINVTPMADVMLVLLIIFMVITPMLQKGISSVELAKTKNPTEMTEADKEDSVLVSIARDGKFYLNQDRVNIDDLSAKVTDLVSSRLDKTIFVKGDFRAKYGDVKQVVDNLRAAGVDKIGLLTEKVDEQVKQ